MKENSISKDFQKGLGMLNGKHYKKAIEFFQRDLDKEPDNYASLNNMGLAKSHVSIENNNISLLEEAIENFKQAICLVKNLDNDEFPIAEANLKWALEEYSKMESK